MKSICFHCHFTSATDCGARCPRCDYPLILNFMASGVARNKEVKAHFAKRRHVDLPGITTRNYPNQHKRREAQRKATERHLKTLKARRRRLAGEIFAASALLMVIAVSLGALF